ncbi:TolB family protein [Kitasatospora sp. NPDC018619]|uniref:TolB family protein n=1 Tax=unclassified Kitasatospora TaxID=2633591 RepID=UPI0037924703
MTHAPARRRLARAVALLAATAVAAGAALPAAEARPPKGATARISEGPRGEQLNGSSTALGLSEDGRYALFASTATDLLPGPGAPNSAEVYVRDLRNGHVERVSVADDGSRLNAPTTDASISGDGRYVAFSTAATNVVPGRPRHETDVFVRDRWTGRTEPVSAGDHDGSYTLGPAISRDGRYVAYLSNRTDLAPGSNPRYFNVLLTDRRTGTTRVVSTDADGRAAGNTCYGVTISADGSAVGFTSRATNLIPRDPATAEPDGDAPDGDAPDGDAPDEGAPGLAPARFYPFFVWRADTGKVSGASLDGNGALRGVSVGARLSSDGRHALFGLPFRLGGPGSNRFRTDLYVREAATGRLTQANAGLPGTTTEAGASAPVVTADGRWVYFDSAADNLVPGDTNGVGDVFRRDLRTGLVERVSLTRDGAQGTAGSSGPFVDATGGTVLFTADDGGLVPGDTNGAPDVFVRHL